MMRYCRLVAVWHDEETRSFVSTGIGCGGASVTHVAVDSTLSFLDSDCGILLLSLYMFTFHLSRFSENSLRF